MSNRHAATSEANKITFKQLGAISAIAQSKGLIAENESLTMYGLTPDRLNRRAASLLIDSLKARPAAWEKVS